MPTQNLSKKGNKLATSVARIDMELFSEAIQNKYHATDNIDGCFALNVAENKPMVGMMKAKMEEILQSSELPEWVFAYTDPTGHPDVKEVMAKFMRSHFDSDQISAHSLAFSAGSAAVIEVATFVLANPGDMVVIPAPAYPMYTQDLGLKTDVGRFDLRTADDLPLCTKSPDECIELLEATLKTLDAQGKKFKILLLTSPDNPTGTAYDDNQLMAMAQWCIQNKIHMVVNEIYGLSRINLGLDNDEGQQASFAKLMGETLSDYLHLWYALSKDFAMSGMRFGLVHSHNEAFIKAFANANIPHMVSNLTQWLVGEVFSDQDFIQSFIEDHRAKLTRSYQAVASMLEKNGIPFQQAVGSLFVWADLSRFLEEESDAAQEKLWIDIFRKTGVLLTPGHGFGHARKGQFRIVHTAVDVKDLEVALWRLEGYFVGLKGRNR